MSKEAMWRLKGRLLSLSTRHYDSELDDCEHIAFTRRLFRGGEIRPPICQHCGTENGFPLNVGLENDEYVLRCIGCNQIMGVENEEPK